MHADEGPAPVARYIPVDEWPGSVIYAAVDGRLYCAAPRGLIPEHPYRMDSLRPPSPQEAQSWGPDVLPRMVIDVTGVSDLHQHFRQRTLAVAPWNTYLVLRLPDGCVVVAYRLHRETLRLDRVAAEQVAIASGHDVDGWSAQVIQHYGSERWHFSPSNWRRSPLPDPALLQGRKS